MGCAGKSAPRGTRSTMKLKRLFLGNSPSFFPAPQWDGCFRAIQEYRERSRPFDTRTLVQELAWPIRPAPRAAGCGPCLAPLETAAFGRAMDFSTPLSKMPPASTRWVMLRTVIFGVAPFLHYLQPPSSIGRLGTVKASVFPSSFLPRM